MCKNPIKKERAVVKLRSLEKNKPR